MSRFVLAGGSGFLGQVLLPWFQYHNTAECTVLSRHTNNLKIPGARVVHWDGRSPGPWIQELEGADALINLAGRSVNCRYTRQNRNAIMQSRVNSTKVLGEAIANCLRPPAVWINASTATIYRHSFDRDQDEKTGTIGAVPEAKDAFSVEVARAWEETFQAASTPKTRKLIIRTAMVLGRERNSVWPVLRRLVRFGLGGSMAGGAQYMSWIHEVDFCRAVQWLMERNGAKGIYNLSAPQPVPNAKFLATMCKLAHMPIGLPASHWMLEIGAVLLRTETELMIKSRRVVPGRLLEEGFRFRYQGIQDALEELENRRTYS